MNASDNPEIHGDLAALRLRKLQLKTEKLKLLRKFGLLHYRPHPKQDAFHRAAKFKHRMVRAGNRFGKSQMGCAEDCAWLLGERPWYPRTEEARYVGIPKRPVKGLVITTDYDKVNEIWTSQEGHRPGKLWQLLPADFVKNTHRNSSGCIDAVFCQNGSALYFDTVKSWANNKQSAESSDWDFVHVDEPCPHALYNAHARGLMDRGGSSWFTLTPLQEVWINDMFFPRRLGHTDLSKPNQTVFTSGTKWSTVGTTYDNPYLKAEDIKEYEDSLDADERACRIQGLPLELAGRVYKEFDWDKHVLKDLPIGWEDFRHPPRNYTLYYGIDPHPQTPHAVLFCAVSPQGQKFFFNEIFHHCVISELAGLIHEIADPYYVARAKCDPLAYISDPITGTTIEEEFYSHGIFVEKATKALSVGILKVKAELKKKDAGLYFSPELEETLWEFERYVWDKDNKPVDKDDHMMENLYRLLMDDLPYVDQATIKNVPIEDEQFDGASTRTDDLE